MAQNSRRNYRIRYDRIIFVAVMLLVMILILSSCISSCGKKDNDPGNTEPGNTLDDQLQTDPVSGTPVPQATQPPKVTYSTISVDTEDVHTGDLILCNAEHPCEFDTAAISEGTSADVNFVTIKSVLDTKTEKHYSASDWEVGLDRDAALAMDSWFEGFYAQNHNTDLRMIGGYRADASDLDFRTGRTLTIGVYPSGASSNFYSATGDYAWLAEHAAEYGFIQRYPEEKDDYFDEDITSRRSAVFRYVGIAPAAYITEKGICLEEFLEEIKAYSIDNMLKVTSGTAQYGMYYMPASNGSPKTSFSVPAGNVNYEISGNNMDGFVITIALNAEAADTTQTEPHYEDLEE